MYEIHFIGGTIIRTATITGVVLALKIAKITQVSRLTENGHKYYVASNKNIAALLKANELHSLHEVAGGEGKGYITINNYQS